MSLRIVVITVFIFTCICASAGCTTPGGESGRSSDGVEPASNAEAQTDAVDQRGAEASGIGGRVFVVERASESLAVYDFIDRKLLDKRIGGLGNMRHATMAFSPDLKWGYVATRNGKLSRINLETLERDGDVFTSENSIDIAISQDGRFIATAEYDPGGVTILDARTLEVVKRIEATYADGDKSAASRVTGIVDAPGNRFVCVMMEGREIWVIDASKPGFPIEHRIEPADDGLPYDAMITPDGRTYVVGHLGTSAISKVDLTRPEDGATKVSLRDPDADYEKDAPDKLPHMASWAVAGDHVFVPLVGEPRLAVLDRHSFEFVDSVELAGPPVYAVRSPNEQHIWVSFSGEEHDAKVQVVDAETLEVERTLEIGGRIYHMDFTPRGSQVLVSANRANKLFLVDATSFEIIDEQPVNSPSGVFGLWRAYQIGL
ncbi:MAG: cytochrome D1 domain-containing protein [Persicimonas sp.]